MKQVIYMNSNGNYLCFDKELEQAKKMGADFRYLTNDLYCNESNENKLDEIINILKDIRNKI
jgi:GH35 family endo-1,4-beta-xylanase